MSCATSPLLFAEFAWTLRSQLPPATSCAADESSSMGWLMRAADHPLAMMLKRMPPAATNRPIFRIRLCRSRSEEHTSELQSRFDLVCRLLLEKKKHTTRNMPYFFSSSSTHHPHLTKRSN